MQNRQEIYIVWYGNPIGARVISNIYTHRSAAEAYAEEMNKANRKINDPFRPECTDRYWIEAWSLHTERQI